MRKERKHFTPEEKVAILRRHLVDKVPVSELCEELGLRPTGGSGTGASTSTTVGFPVISGWNRGRKKQSSSSI